MTSPRSRTQAFLLAVSLTTSSLLAAPNGETADNDMTLTDVAHIQQASDATISPNGENIAYLASIPRNPFAEDDGKPKKELRVIGKDGSERLFVAGMASIHTIGWTPDGTHITFLGKRESDDIDNVFVIPLAGGEARQLSHHPRKVREVSFARDSKRFAFVAEEAIPDDIESIRERGFDQKIYEEDKSQRRIWISNRGDGTESVDDAAEPKMLEIDASASELHWSPVADHLLVALQPTPLIDDRYMRRALQVIAVETGESVASFGNVGKLGSAAWSPDGTRVAYISAADLNDPQAGRLMSAAAVGGDSRDVLPGYEGHIRSFAWSDADTLLFVGDRGVQCELGSVGADGSSHSSFHLESDPWSDIEFNSGVASLLGNSPSHPTEVFRWTADESAPVRLTNSNPWLSERSLVPPRVVRYEARDGLDVEGILYAPAESENGKRIPLVMVVHGGPESHFRNGWLDRYSYPTQTLVSRGFAVFFANYRGSTGRGVEYSKLDQGDAGGREFDDLVDGIDHLVEIGLVDKDRVGITGGSYGGFASAWGATYYSHRYAASVMFVGISNQLSKSGTTDIFNEMSLVHWLSKPWEKWHYYLERSPIYHVEKARTPLLILHGQKDPRVHPEQSLELYRYVKAYGQAPVRLVLYPQEEHGNRRAAAQFDYSLRLVRWMEHYLRGSRDDKPPAYGLDHEGSWTHGSPITEEKNWWR